MITIRPGVCAALVLACALLIASAAWGVYVQDYDQPEDFRSGALDQVSVAPEIGGVSLSQAVSCVSFLWVPSPDDGTVSKIDARTGVEMARYRTGPRGAGWSPCSVATDLQGNAYVACACSGAKGKIVKILASAGPDTNHDGVITTSGDYDANLRITPSEVLDWGRDDRVTVFAEVGGPESAPSCLSFDGRGQLWVGLYGERSVVRVDPSTGNVTASVFLIGRPSAMVVDSRNYLWVASRQNKNLCEIDTVTATLVRTFDFGERVPGAMCLDNSSRLWIGDTMGGLMVLQTDTGVWSRYDTNDGAQYYGVTVDRNGDIWATCPSKSMVDHFSGKDGEWIDSIPVGKSPDSVCADDDGYVWVLNRASDTATRIDVSENKAVLTALTGPSPVSSTPFAAIMVKKGLCPEGTWRTLVDSRIKGAGWGMLTWNSDNAGGEIKVEVRSAETPLVIGTVPFTSVESGKRFSIPNGRYLEVCATLRSGGGSSPILHAMRVEGTNLPPDVSKAEPTIARILRIDHTMESVGIEGITDPEDDPVDIVITGVTQDEPVSGLGPGDTSPDAIITGGAYVWLRGEFDPGTKEKPGNGRVYRVSFKATDSLGAASTGKVSVTVPPGILPKDVAIDDGQKYISVREIFDLVAQSN